MNAGLAHRGPNAEGSWLEPGIALGHKRLSIIDLNPRANQPMHSPCGRYVLVYNGEIYNFDQLAGDMREAMAAKGLQLRSSSDTEVLLYGLMLYGESFLERCNGMFAFAFYDREHRSLLLGRDRLGIKPLYYFRDKDCLVFSSELRACLASGLVPRRLDERALADYLRYQCVHGERSIVQGVSMLPPGTCLHLDEDEEGIRYWWHPITHGRSWQGMSREALKAEIRSSLQDSVRQRLISDVPFGAFLSGGIDSSAVVALAARECSGSLRTFTVSFAEAKHDESHHAQRIAERFATDHREIRLSADHLLQSLPQALGAMDHPTGDGINTYVVAGAAREAGISVALSGLGSDELFGGYPVFQQLKALQQKKWLLSYPRFVRAGLAAAYKRIKPGVASDKIAKVLCEDYFDVDYVYPYSRELCGMEELRQVLRKYIGGADEVFAMLHREVAFGTEGYALPLSGRISYAELRTYLHSVLLRDTDQMSMAHALEVRVPFLDHRLVELLMYIPDSERLSEPPKQLLLESLADLLDPELFMRPKQGFTFPWEEWMRGGLRDFCESHINALAKREQFNGKELLQRWKRFDKKDPRVSWSRIWYLCALEAWLQNNEVS